MDADNEVFFSEKFKNLWKIDLAVCNTANGLQNITDPSETKGSFKCA